MSTPRWKMALDVERCIGCHACSVACKVENKVPLGRFRTKVYYLDEGKFPKVRRSFLPTLCMQCEDAPCLKACPHTAIKRADDGIIKVVADLCEHDGACEAACPYGAIGCDDNDVADKCDFCSHRLAANMEPACVETCPAGVFHFGDANDPKSAYSTFMEKNGKDTKVLKREKNTRPSVTYRGHNVKMEAKVPKGHVSQKYLTEIVHHNPLWINADTAARYGIRSGDLVEITTYRPQSHQMKGGGEVLGRAQVPAYVTEGIHPRVIAMSNSLGNMFHGRVATARRGRKQDLPTWNEQLIDEDQDIRDDIWWDPRRGGTGAGYNINAILPIHPAPLIGIQSWYDTICTIKRATA